MLRPLLVANFDRVVGGGEVGLLMLADGLHARGHRPLLVVPGPGGLAGDRPHVEVPHDPRRLAVSLGDLARSHDVVQVSSPVAFAAAEAAVGDTPILYHALVPDPAPVDDAITRRADVIVCNSAATARRFADAPRVEIVLNGVAPLRPGAPGLGLHPHRRTVAVIGSTVPRKGQLDVLDALLEVVETTGDVDVVFIGRVGGPEGLRLRRVARGSGGRVRLLGFVPGVADRLGELALVVVPSRSEGFGRVAVEALRAGVPVLARRVGGLVEALQDLHDPWLPDKATEWAARIRRELDAPFHTPDELRAAARRFDPDRFVDRLAALHERLAARRDPRSVSAPVPAP
ncbi:MAG: glycosyltransferase family 4 protein [Acidimicrobiales bacterium]|jgi:glycosyltransferase involved in cell wall biosynthesis|nr:glycosyltransferase family 4 protein [Acidimicrobiales bacterium]